MRLTMLLDMVADADGDRIVVGSRRGGISAAELRVRARRGAEVVRSHDADAVVYLGTNGPAFPVAMFAAAFADVPLVPLNYRLGAEQLDALLAHHRGAFGIGDAAGVEVMRRAGIQAVTTEQWLADTSRPVTVEIEEPWDFDRTAVIIYTSGSTSAPKGVVLRHGNLTSYVLGTVEFLHAQPSDAALVSVPPYHIAAVANVLSNLYGGRRTLVLEQFSPQEWLDTVRAEEITHALVVPTMLARIVESGVDVSVPSLRNLAYGGAPMPATLIERALRMWPEVGFVNAYGLTETSSTIAVLGPEQHREALASSDPHVRARLSSVGHVVPGIDLVIRDDQGAVLPPGEFGHICVRGEQVSAEYEGLGALVDDDGYFDTRDSGYLDAAGYLFIGGRVDDTIIRGAENIAPAEIEDVILRHPEVLDAAVVGVPDDEWGQRIEAVVVLRADGVVDAEEMRAFVLARLRSSKTPDRFHFWSSLGRTETGKLVRREVLARVVSGEVPV